MMRIIHDPVFSTNEFTLKIGRVQIGLAQRELWASYFAKYFIHQTRIYFLLREDWSYLYNFFIIFYV